MNLPEFIISGVKPLKFGEYVISLKIKPEDHTPEMIEYFREQWREGTPHAGVIEKFQDEEENSGQEDGAPLKSKPESIYAQIEKWFALNKGKNEYEKWKRDRFFEIKGFVPPSGELHLRDFLPEAEAWKDLNALEISKMNL